MIACLTHALEPDSIRISRLEKEVEELQETLSELLVQQASPSANPSILGDVYFATLDILYWYARTNGTAFAYTNSSPLTSTPITGRTKDISFDWEWGLRASLGKNLDHDKWDAALAFTLYRPHFSGKASVGMNGTLIPLRGGILVNSGVTHAKSSYALDTYQIDLELGRHYFISSKLSFRPFVGVKNAWMKQRQVVRYTGGAINTNTVHIEDNCDYWGVGVRGGVNSKWYLADGFYLHGLVAGALLYGFFDIDHREKLSINAQDTIKLDDNKHRFIPTVQWKMGIGWGSYLHERKHHLDLGVSYEGMYWWRLNQMIKIYEYNAYRYDNYSEDVSMHGLTLTVRWSF